jgi:hypothetical protein
LSFRLANEIFTPIEPYDRVDSFPQVKRSFVMTTNRKLTQMMGWTLAGVLGAGAMPVSLAVATPAAVEAAKPAATPQAQVNAIVKSYLAVQKLLAADKTDGVAAEMKTLAQAATALGEKSADDKVKEQVKAVAKAAGAEPKDLKQTREAFKGLSTAVIALVQVAPPTAEVSSVLYQATCPMVKASWLQGSKDIANPYMGSQMLDCGEVQKKIEAATADKIAK